MWDLVGGVYSQMPETLMSLHTEHETLTTQEIADLGGANALHDVLIARAFDGASKHIKDGPKHVIKVETRKPKEIKNLPGSYLARVLIWYWFAEPDEAKINDIVYAPLLQADDKGAETPRFEATYKGMRFDPDPEGWRRVS